MKKIYKVITSKTGIPASFFERNILLFLITVSGFCINVNAQVSLTASVGVPVGNYTTLKGAFDAINTGSHQGNIIISINANTNEGANSATLNSKDADPCSYTSILIRPTGNNITISGAPAAGFGVIQLNGSDNVTIDGDNPNTGGTNRNLSINNTAAATVVGNSCIRIATSAAVLNADNINISNCNLNGNVTSGNASGITSTAGSSNISFGIYVGGNGGATPTGAPTAITSATANTAPAGTTVEGLNIQSNSINQCARAIVFNGADATVSSGVTITQNSIGASGGLGTYPYDSPANTVYASGIWISGTNSVEITSNTIDNILSYIAGPITAIELNANIGTRTISISNNTITGVANNSASSAGLAAGVLVNSANGPFTIDFNNINTVENTAGSTASPAVGIRINTNGAAATINSNQVTGVFNRNTGGWPARGIDLSVAANACVLQNNFVSNIMNAGASSFGNTFNVNGILLNSGNSHKIYHNSVNMYGISTSTSQNSINCLSINANTLTGYDIRNNIFSNTVTGGSATDVHTCIFMPFAAAATMDLTLNNNGYYTGTTAGLHGIAYTLNAVYTLANLLTVANFNPLATIPANNFRSFSTSFGVLSNDLNSFGDITPAPFTSPTDLHIPNGTFTRLESGAVPVGVSVDIDIAVRDANYPDIGADEFAGTIDDQSPPLIVYTPLLSTCTLGNRTLNATITDASGTGAAPELYWKINAGAYTNATGVPLGGNIFQFTFGAGAVLGDVVSYYIVAEDAVGNVIANPSVGAGGYTTAPPAAATPPTTPSTYTIQNILAPGIYDVGTLFPPYTTITAAINAYNNSCLAGPITFRLMDAFYPSEIYPIVISNPLASAVNTLTIVPNAGNPANITGDNGSSMFKLNGADYITFDGLNTGGSSLTIKNNNAANTATVFWIASVGSTNPATNNSILNCNISGFGPTAAVGCIIAGSGTVLGNIATAANSNNTITGCTFKGAQNGIFVSGYSGSFDQNWNISNNTFGSAVVADKLGFRGLSLQWVNNYTISGNTINGVVVASSSAAQGIAIYNIATNGTITKNRISDIKNTSSGGSYGINLNSVSNTSGVAVNNNFIWDVSSFGSATLANNGNGIVVNTGGGYSIYFNSVNMATNQSNTSSITSAIRIAPAVTFAGGLNIRNNIFANTTTVGQSYSIYSSANAGVFNNIDYNDYHRGASTLLGFLGAARTSLAAWQTATGKDLKSVSINPLFITATDLHLQPLSPLNALAQTGTGVTVDIDNEARTANPDMGADEFDATDCSGTPAGGTISTLSLLFCVSGTPSFTATGFTSGDGISYQWQYSTDGFTTPVDIVGQTLASNCNAGVIATTTSFRLKVFCSISGLSGFSNVILITVNSPQVTTNTPATRCGTGTVNLGATSITPGASLNWYSTPTGGALLFSSASPSTFTTPVIAATTNYYVEASAGATPGTVGPLSPTVVGGFGQTTFATTLNFNILQPITLNSVDIFPSTAGNAGQILVKNSLGTIIGTYNYTSNVSGGITPQTITMNLAIPSGNGYTMENSTFPGTLTRNTSGASYPYTTPAVSITGNGAAITGNYYYFYNWQYVASCPSTRVTVAATVTAPPAITPIATPSVICLGSSSTLSVTSGNAGYTYVWTPGSLPGASVSVSPATSTTYTVTANDGVCGNTGTVFVDVRPNPTAVAVVPATLTICSGVPATLLTGSGGTLSNITALSQDFNAPTNNWITINNSTGGVPADAAWTLRPSPYAYTTPAFSSNDASQFYLSNSDDQGSGGTTSTILQSPAFSLTGYTSANLSFWHHFRILGGPAVVEASTDGSTWVAVPGGTFAATTGATNGFVNVILNMNTYAGQPVVYVRFNYITASFAWWWAIDNVNVTGTVTTAMTWTQLPAAPNYMFTNAAGTIPYIAGTPAASIYAAPGVSTVFTATATGPAPSFCKSTATSTFTVNSSVASVSITSVPSGPICTGTSVTFTANPIGGGAGPTYQWYLNGGPIATGPTYTTATLVNGDIIRVDMTSNSVCVVGNPFASPNVTMTVNPIPTCSIAGPDPVCAGSTGNIYTSTVLPAGGTVTHSWTISGNGIIVGGTNGASVTVTAGVAGSYIVTDNITREGCASVCTKTVTVSPGLPVSVSISTPTLTICSGVPVTFTAVPTNGGGAPVFQWKVNGFNTALGNPFITAALVNGDVVTCELTSNAACATGSPAISNSLTMIVVGAAPASVTISPSASTCTGTPITFTATPTNGGGAPTYEFFVNTVSQGVQAGNTFLLAVPANGDQVYVVMTSSFSCATGSPATSSTYTVALNASPTVTAAADCNNILTGSGQTATLTATAAAGSGSITTYQWVLAPSTNVGLNLPTYNTNVAGSYTVIVTNSNGCSTTSAVPVVITSTTPALAAGTYFIPSAGCSGFSNISSAVNYINSYGVAGAVIFSITPAYTETAPVGGFAITATGTLANTITFQRNGAGANPVITAGLQVAGTNNDGIFKIIGGDYITIQDLTMQENAGNTVTATGATNTMTEWAVALLYASTTNGPNNNTIQNNTISLNKVYPNSFAVYSNLRHTAVAPAVQADITNTTGGSNKIYANAISNINIPILFLSSGVGMSPGNDIGGISALTGNTITNWGSNTLPNVGTQMFGVFSSMIGMSIVNQTGINISWNSLTSSTGVIVGGAGFRGIYTDFATTSPTGTFTNSITNNTITLNNAAISAGAYEAINQSNSTASAAVAGITLNINNNTITSVLTGVASTSAIVGIVNSFPSGVLSISDNIIKGNTSTGTGAFTGISNTAAVATTININTNQLGDVATNAITFSVATAAAVNGIIVSGAGAAAVLTLNGNTFTRFVHTVTGTSAHNYINVTSTPATQNITNNSVTNITTNSNGAINGIVSPTLSANKVISGNTFTGITGGSGTVTLISSSGGSVLANINTNNIGNNLANNINGTGSLTGIATSNLAGGIVSITGNTCSGLRCTGVGGSLISGIQNLAPTTTVTSNSINNLNSSGVASNIYGLFLSGTTISASLNTIHTITGTGTGAVSANGILLAGTGTSVNLFKNRIYNLSETAPVGAAASLVNGISITSGTNVNVRNNFISDLRAPASTSTDAIRGISISSAIALSTYSVFYNSIYLNATSVGANFGTTGLFHTGNAIATTAALNLRNNIIDNESVFNGTGRTVAFRRGSVLVNLVNYATASNNNSFFAGTPGVNNLVFFDGTTGDQTITAFQTRVNTPARDAASVNVKPNFINIATTPYDLHLQAALSCSFDGFGDNTTILIADDFDGDARSVVPSYITDIGADEFAGTGVGVGMWKGVNANWTDINNWCDAIPTTSTNVTIPAGSPFYPVITTAIPVANNITIAAGGSVTITGIGKLGIAGTMTNGGTFNVVDGTIEMLGTAAQTIPAAIFQNNDLKNLVINNGAGVTLGGALNLYGKLSFTGSNRAFATAGFLTLRSTATGTASVGDITNNLVNTGNTITGDVSVERFASARRAWRFLSVPTQNNLQTIKESWQENQVAAAPLPVGYGTQISKDSANWAAYGFDNQTTPGPSMKTYVPATNKWKGITSTVLVPGVSDGKFVTGTGYMVMVRGDRTITTFPAVANASVLRSKGALVTGTFAAPAIGAGLLAAIGNPYASAVDFTKLTRTNLNNVYYLWDPQMGTLGAYVTFTGPGYIPSGSISYNPNNFIESGQAFFVQSSGPAGTLSFPENSKVDGSNLVSRPTGTEKLLRTNLYVTTDGTPHLYDGIMHEFDNSYSNAIDGLDAAKLINFGENLGIKKADSILSVERMPELTESDTIFYNLANVRVKDYQFEFIAENIDQPGLTGFLEDRYLQTSTVVSLVGTTKVNFSVINDAGSYAADRFRLVFKQTGGPVPVTFTSVRANKQNKDILVEWKVENELNIHHYDVEKSANGRNFSKVGEQQARGTGSGSYQYNWLDTQAWDGDNYYRIRSVGVNSEAKQSQVVKVNMGKQPSSITIFPNPVREDGMLYVNLDNKPSGTYQVKLLNTKGQTVMVKTLNHAGGSSVYSIMMDKLVVHGNYLVSITGEGNEKLSFKIVY